MRRKAFFHLRALSLQKTGHTEHYSAGCALRPLEGELDPLGPVSQCRLKDWGWGILGAPAG